MRPQLFVVLMQCLLVSNCTNSILFPIITSSVDFIFNQLLTTVLMIPVPVAAIALTVTMTSVVSVHMVFAVPPVQRIPMTASVSCAKMMALASTNWELSPVHAPRVIQEHSANWKQVSRQRYQFNSCAG